MTTRAIVDEFVALGPLPESSASEEVIAKHEALLIRIQKPVTDEEAAVLADCFGPDDCYGLAWTLLHLVESAPSGIPVKEAPSHRANEWIKRLWARSHRS